MRPRLLLLLLALLIPSAAPATVVISEFLARNSTSIRDEDGERSDWIELFNAGPESVELGGWHLTDDAAEPTKWTFPPWELEPGQYLVVFASDKDRARPGAELHANFKLAGEGEYLALVRPDGRTPASEFAPQYPPQEPDIAYGLPPDAGIQRIGGEGRYLVPRDGSLGLDWLQPDFDDGAWTSGVASFGYETTSGYQDLIGTDLEAPMHLGPTSVYLRFPFELEAPDQILTATFRMQYDDGFIAYLNGTPIARGNAPREPSWNSAATAFHDDSVVRTFTTWPVDTGLLRPGTNVLAVHGLNENPESSDLLLTPQLDLHTEPRLLDGAPLYLPVARDVAALAALTYVKSFDDGVPDGYPPWRRVHIRST